MMGLIKFLRSKMMRRKRVAAVDLVADDQYHLHDDGKKKSRSVFKVCWEDVERFTVNLSYVIGSGGFSTVYLARLPDSSTAAVKIQCCATQRLRQAYNQELQILLHLNHPNIVNLIGHCDDREEEGVLILEHVANGTLHEKLHNKATWQLPWRTRMRIAYQLCEALHYLHNTCNIIHGDIKASNILLDRHLDCKLCDFGSSQFSSPRPTRRPAIMHGSPGYTDPSYLKTGQPCKTNDVYSFGVILLELVTGMEALDPLSGRRLTARVEPWLRGGGEMVEIVDPGLRRDFGFDVEEAMSVVELSALCVSDTPTNRPSLSRILATMRDKISCMSEHKLGYIKP